MPSTSTSTDTLPLDAPLLPPLILRPPLGPRVVRGLVMLLAFILIGLTAGWSHITDGREGELAGAARMLLLGGGPVETVSPSGPLTVWLCKGSMNLFGVNELAARLPSALASLATIWLVLRMGERFGGTWRGLVAGMLLLCTPGMFTLGRVLSSAPLEMAFLAALFSVLQRAYEQRAGRRQWLVLAWFFLVCAFFSGGWTPVFTAVLAVTVLMLRSRKARIRFAGLFSREAAVLIGLTIVGAWASDFRGVPSSLPASSLGQVFGWQGLLLFPWSILLIPAAWRLGRRLILRMPLEWEEAFPLVWLACGSIVIAFSSTRSLFDTLILWPAFALWAARALEITSQLALLRGILVTLGLGLIALLSVGRLQRLLATTFPATAEPMIGIPPFLWSAIGSVFLMGLLAFVLGLAAVFTLELYHHRRFAMVGLFGALVPTGYACADIASKLSPYISHADIARCIGQQAGPRPALYVDSNRYVASSLWFYLDHALLPFHPIAEPTPAHRTALRQQWEAERVFLLTRQLRLDRWESLLGPSRTRAECESGSRLLLVNPYFQKR